MGYPAGNNGQTSETVYFTYLPQMTPDSVTGQFPYAYVSSTNYDLAGRVARRTLGAANISGSPQMQQRYNYYAWNLQGGGLSSIQSQVVGGGVLQNLVYSYDGAGNVKTIQDVIANQTQNFGYDKLDRLISASANGSQGAYSETYSYNGSTGNLSSKNGMAYTYGDAIHKHAVTVLSGGGVAANFQYDANGNMTTRQVNGQTYTLGYDAENHMASANKQISPLDKMAAKYIYDGNGARVMSVITDTVQGASTVKKTVFLGKYYEWSPGQATKYYFQGGTLVAMRQNDGQPLRLLGDHLGSTNKVIAYNGGVSGEERYKAGGETRLIVGDIPTQYQFTGQYREKSLGLDYYGARWYDSLTNRFTQPDTIVPLGQGVQAWNRYAAMNNNTVKYTDPGGHAAKIKILGEYEGLSAADKLANTVSSLANRMGIKFECKQKNNNPDLPCLSDWTDEQKGAVLMAAIMVAKRFPLLNIVDAFKSVYKQGLIFVMDPTCTLCPLNGAHTDGNIITWQNLVGLGREKSGWVEMADTTEAVLNVVHELGHAFDQLFWTLATKTNNQPSMITYNGSRLPQNSDGFAYRVSKENTYTELFADMFVGWVIGQWAQNNYGSDRRRWMENYMPGWISTISS